MATATKAKKKTVRIASGLKRARQDIKLNAANTALRSRFRTVIKNVQKAVDAGDKAKAAELFKTAQPIPRAGLPDDIAQAAVFLASDESSFVNGHDLVVDGAVTGGRNWSQQQQGYVAMRKAFDQGA